MKTAFWLLMEFILFGFGATFGLFSVGGIVTFPSIFEMKSDAAMLGALLVPVVSIVMTFVCFKGYGAAARRRRGQYVLKRSIHRSE